MVEPTGNRQNEYTKKATKTEIQEWVEEYVYNVLEGDDSLTGVSGTGGGEPEDPEDPEDPPENKLVSIKFLNDSGTEYIDPRDENGNFIPFGDVVTEKDGKVYVNVKAEIQDARDKETVEYWKVQLDGGFVRERQEVKKFTYKNLEPNKEYTTVIRSFNKNNKGIGNSGPIRFKTKLANNSGDKPPPVTNLQGFFDGRTLKVTWDYDNPPSDFNNFVVIISKTDDSGLRRFATLDKSFSITKNELVSFFGSQPTEIKVTVHAINRRGILSDPVTIIVTEGCLDAPTNVKLEAAVLGYIVSWDTLDTDAYQATAIYESDSENGEYVFVYSSSTSPIFVPSTNFTPRFIKIGHASFTDKVCELVATTPKSVIPINPIQIDTTPPGIVTNASATFDGSTYKLTFDKPIDTDIRDFMITLVGSSPDGSSTRTTFLPVAETSQQLFQLTIDENKNFFGSPKNTIVASIKTRDLTSNISAAVENISATFVDSPSIPTNVNFVPGILSYTATWDEPTYGLYANSRIYESSTEEGTYTLVSFGKTPVIVFTNSSDARWVKVSHTSIFGAESEKTSPVLVTPINPVSVDTDPPDQRSNIFYTPEVNAVSISWENPIGDSNLDLAGVTVRYSASSDPTNYIWVDIPFSNDNLISSAKISNLLPNTDYLFSLSSFDKTQNRTSYSTETEVTTLINTTPPPRPVAPSVSAGNGAAGPMTIRVIQDSLIHNTSNPLPLEVSYFKIFMLDSGFTSAPAIGISTNANASEVGIIQAGFNGSSTQTTLYIPLTSGEQRYFYTRAVDTSGNISDASVSTQSSSMTVLSDAFITNLSADKILTGTLQASRSIKVGTTSNQITIISESGGTGKIYSGLGSYNSSDTGFYVDSSGQFSLKDRLIWNPSGTDPITGQSTGLLTIKGSIEAQSGSFTGNVRLSNGSLYAGTNPDSGQRLILNSSGITGYNSSGSNKFTLTTEGRLTAQLGTIGGWTIADTTLSSSNVTIDSTNKRITFGASNQLIIGQDVGGTGKHGLYIDANDYIYGDGTFSLGNGSISWNGATLSVTGSGSFSGSITASSGSITGPLQIGEFGYLYAGASATSGARVVITKDGIAGYSSEVNNPQVFILTPSSSSIAGWSINTSTLEKTASGVTIKLDSANGQITAGNLSSTVGFRSTSSGAIAIWAGTQSPSTASPFYVTNTGDVVATRFQGYGINIIGGAEQINVGGRGPTTYSVLSNDGKDILLRAGVGSGGDGPAKIRWLDSANGQRGTIGWEITNGGSQYPNTMVLRANSENGGNSGNMLITAGNLGTINLDAQTVTINGASIETPTEVRNRYKNGIVSSPTVPNQIRFGTDPVSTGFPAAQASRGDIYLRY